MPGTFKVPGIYVLGNIVKKMYPDFNLSVKTSYLPTVLIPNK